MLAAGVFLALLTLSSSHTSKQTCPKKWIAHPKRNACYLVSHRKLTSHNAKTYCHLHNSSLLRIESARENQMITELNLTESSWLDARARFDIVDGSSGLFAPGFVLRWPNNRSVRYSEWARGSGPLRVSSTRRCVQINPQGHWLNTPCHVPAHTICEKRLRRSQSCPRHWTYRLGYCYRATVRENMTMLTADNRCFQYGDEINQDAMLASVASTAENQFIMSLARDKLSDLDFVLLGGIGAANDAEKWMWIDGSRFSYHNWERGMPHGQRQMAVLAANRRGRWTNHRADGILSQYKAVAVCKFKP